MFIYLDSRLNVYNMLIQHHRQVLDASCWIRLEILLDDVGRVDWINLPTMSYHIISTICVGRVWLNQSSLAMSCNIAEPSVLDEFDWIILLWQCRTTLLNHLCWTSSIESFFSLQCRTTLLNHLCWTGLIESIFSCNVVQHCWTICVRQVWLVLLLSNLRQCPIFWDAVGCFQIG